MKLDGYLEGLGKISWDLFGVEETYPKTLTVKITFWSPRAVFFLPTKKRRLNFMQSTWIEKLWILMN